MPVPVVQAVVEELVGMPVEPDQPLMEAGLDSIGALELRNLVCHRWSASIKPGLGPQPGQDILRLTLLSTLNAHGLTC